jgi:protein-S-isoprenylcysteine O-methyltransferase Ste14
MNRLTLILWSVTKVAVAVVFVGAAALRLRRLDSYVGVGLPVWSRIPGVVGMVAGGLIVIACGSVLANRGIFSMPGQRLLPREFVTFGPFRYVRNPMSLGFVTLMAGLGLYESSVSIILFAAGLFLFLHLIVVYVEEPGLEKRFGESYCEYKRSVDRWLPRFGAGEWRPLPPRER